MQLIEYAAVSLLLLLPRAVPQGFVHAVSRALGLLFFHLVTKRRTIALLNLRAAFGTKDEAELQALARESFASFFLTYFEIVRFRGLFSSDRAAETIEKSSGGVQILFRKARRIHDESKGCIFVTPHIGNWELLPHVSGAVGIPLVVVVRPLDNPYLEKLLYEKRTDSGQMIIPKRNALFALQKTLQQGKSVGMLPDQSTMHGIVVDFFGREAFTTPVPAILAVTYKRPIVVVACCRSRDVARFEGVVSDPIFPGEYTSERDEIRRLTEEMNRAMEVIIRRYPEQYLWMHNRWKTYKKKEFLR